MVNLMQRIKQVKQPRGGYLNPKTMKVHFLGDHSALSLAEENIHASLVGMAVDYLARWCLGYQKESYVPVAEPIFTFSQQGAQILDTAFGTNHVERVADLCQLIDASREFNSDTITPPTAEAIAAAVELASFDGVRHAGVQVYSADTNTTPDAITIQHIATMVDRSLAFFDQYGPVLTDGFVVSGGDTAGVGDFLTYDTLWDFKVSVKTPTSANTLQVLALWIMGQRSDWDWTPGWNRTHTILEPEWRSNWELDDYLSKNRSWPDDLHGPTPTHIAIYNPRLDTVYRIEVATIPAEIIEAVARDVLGYK